MSCMFPDKLSQNVFLFSTKILNLRENVFLCTNPKNNLLKSPWMPEPG